VPLDEVVPEYAARERHERVVELAPEEAVAAALAARPDAATRLLFRIRGLPHTGTFADLFARIGFEELRRTPREVIYGSSGRPWLLCGGIAPFDAAGPGTVRMALSLAAEPIGTRRSRLVTETRVQPLDDAARRAFRRYWFVVGRFSALTRRRWLRAVR
jgi:hypothetical protein